MAAPLLRTKLYIPPTRPDLVSRPRLVERLNAGLPRKLTLVSAPAGFGKTTLLSEWVAGCERPVAWLSLDEGDNDPARFFAYLVAALQTVLEHIGASALAALQSPQPLPMEAVLTGLINEITTVGAGLAPAQGDREGRPYVLVLDDYHLISNQPIHQALAFLLDHLPPTLHLVIATRADPPLPLARLRARGQLTELRSADLRFTSEETAAFFNRVMGLNLSAADAAMLESRTEGWVAGLQMAALSIQDREDISGFIETFSGSHRFVLDYLVEEVLDQQPTDVREFLLRTSILERLSGPLCDATLENGQPSQEMLERLEKANLFVIPLDDERRWYRYHRLFADLLRSRLMQKYSHQWRALHIRAAAWFEENGFINEAIHHALAAGEQERAAALIEHHAMAKLMKGELTTLLNWLRSIEPLARERPWLSIYQSWALTLSGQLDHAERSLQEAAHLVEACPAGVEADSMAGHIAAIRTYQAAQKGEPLAAIDLAGQALACLSAEDAAIRGVVLLSLGTARRQIGDLAGASRAMADAVRAGQASGNTYLALGALSGLADMQFDQGKLHQAYSSYDEMLQGTTGPGGQRLPSAGMALFGLGLIFYEWNRLDAALEHAEQAIELCRTWGNVGILMASHALLSRIRQAQGATDSAYTAMNEAMRLARANPLAPRAVGWVEAFQARSWLAQGEVEPAARWVEQRGLDIDDDFSFLHEAEYVAFGRVLLAQGRFDTALALFERLCHAAESSGRMGNLIEALCLRAMAKQMQSDASGALADLGRALSLAEPEGYVRAFLDEGALMAGLLREALTRGISPNYVAELLAAFSAEPAPSTPAMEALPEPLSERELEVLRLIVAGLSNAEIAKELVIAVSTVKSHVNHIYGKLGVESRTRAVAKARELGLL